MLVWKRSRRSVWITLVRGVPIKKIARDLRVSKNTVRKVVRGDETSFSYERKIQPMPKLGPWVEELERQLEANEKKARKDRLSRRFDEGLDEHGRCVVALGPVQGQAPADEGEDVRAQVGDGDPGQDQELGLSTTEREVLLARSWRPADEVVARSELHAAVEKPSMAMGQPFRSWTAP